MASGEGQSNPSTFGDAGGDHNEDYGNEYGPTLPTQEELREMEHRRLVGEATNMMLNFAKDPKLTKYMTETTFQDVHAQWKATTTSPPKPDSKKQYSEKELEEEVEARLVRILGAQDKSKKHDKKRKKSTDFPGFLGILQIRAKKTEGQEAKQEATTQEGQEKMRKSKSRRVDESSTEDTSTDSSDSEDGQFYANKKNFYKANQYDFLEDQSKKVREFKGGQSIKFETFSGYKDALKALSFIQQFDIAFAGGRYSTHSKIRRAASYFKGNARTWWSTLLLNKTAPVKWLKFKKLFISSWLKQEYEHDIRAAWNHLRMTKRDTVDAYCERFWSAFLPASSFKKISFREQIERFTLGLPTEIRDHCLEQKSASIQELMSHAKRGFAIHSSSLTYPTDEGMTQQDDQLAGNDSRKRKRYPEKKDARPKLTPQERARLIREGKCFGCGERGHISAKCPKKAPKEQKDKDEDRPKSSRAAKERGQRGKMKTGLVPDCVGIDPNTMDERLRKASKYYARAAKVGQQCWQDAADVATTGKIVGVAGYRTTRTAGCGQHREGRRKERLCEAGHSMGTATPRASQQVGHAGCQAAHRGDAAGLPTPQVAGAEQATRFDDGWDRQRVRRA
ncbi:hypothetical protein L7F22_006918 [Adiantum nelumboides]|nr:hypothetical protein [Adiantum nelumboides]